MVQHGAFSKIRTGTFYIFFNEQNRLGFII